MHRSLSFRRNRSPRKPSQSISLAVQPIQEDKVTVFVHSREQIFERPNLPQPVLLQRSRSRREKFANAIANPDAIFKQNPASPPASSKFNVTADSKWARTLFGNGRGVDYGSGVTQTPMTPSPHPSDIGSCIFSAQLISPTVAADLPNGYSIRPLSCSDYDRGFMDVISIFGETGCVSESKWMERCEFLQSMASTYFVVVIVKHGRTEEEDRVVATGTVFFEHKFLHGLGVVGHVEDIAVARDQKGKRMGLSVLEALLFAAKERGCYKTTVNCGIDNERFHAQAGFRKQGSQMVLLHRRAHSA